MQDSKSEHILLPPSCVVSVVLSILKDNVKEAADEALGETQDVVEVIELDLEDYEVATSG